MKKHFFLLSALCVLLTSCDNYTSSHKGHSGSVEHPNSSTDASGRPYDARDVATPPGQQPVGPASHVNPDVNRNNLRDQGR